MISSGNTTYLENAKTNVSNWMYSNFKFFNPSKTEFLNFGLLKLFKLNNSTIHLPNNIILLPADSAGNLGVIFDPNMLFTHHILCRSI